MIEKDVTKHRRDNIMIMNKERHKQRRKSNNQLKKNERHKLRQKATINSRRCDHQCFQKSWLKTTQWKQQLTRLGFIRELGVDLLDKNNNIILK